MTGSKNVDGDGERRWVTMGEVAERAGVSKITVSRVLRAPAKVKPETRARVETIIRELGYVPDEAAGALSSRKSRIVGALVSTLAGSTFASTVDGLSGRLRPDGYQLLLATTEYSPDTEAEIIPTLLGRRPDGLVMTSTEHTPAARALLENAGLPIVELWDLPENPIDCAVGFSNFEAGAAMTRYLFARGYVRPAFVGGRSGADARAIKRFDGYASVVRDVGSYMPRTLRVDTGGDNLAERGARGLAMVLERWPETDAVFCSSDAVALGALSEARRRGLDVPGDLAIAGYGDFEFAGKYGLGLTTVRIPGREIGIRAAELILDRAKAPDGSKQSIDLGFEIITRATA